MRLLIVAALLLASCGGSARQTVGFPDSDLPGTETVMLTMDARQQGSTIIIEGTTDLPDGALVAFEVTQPDSLELADGHIRVQGGRYSETVDVSGWPAGETSVWVAFQTVLGTSVSQPQEVIHRYGQMGENLTGPNVTQAGDVKRVELETTLNL